MSSEGLADVRATKPPGSRGQLRIYLGSAAGVGKTFAMLNEGHRRRERGTDVVVGVRRGARTAAHLRADR